VILAVATTTWLGTRVLISWPVERTHEHDCMRETDRVTGEGFGSSVFVQCNYSAVNLTLLNRPIEICQLRSNECYNTMNMLQ
jgi:hypothetical protein